MTAAERAREISGPCVVKEVPAAFREGRTQCPDHLPDSPDLWCSNCDQYRRALLALLAHEAEVREECAKIAERRFPRGSAHTYASENADRYIAQEETCELIAKAIRDAGREKERR